MPSLMGSVVVRTSIANMSLLKRNRYATVARLLTECETVVHLLTASKSGVYLSTASKRGYPSTEDVILSCQSNTNILTAHRLGVLADMNLSLARWSAVHQCLPYPSSLLLNTVILVDLPSNMQLFATVRMDTSIPFTSCLHLVRSVVFCMIVF